MSKCVCLCVRAYFYGASSPNHAFLLIYKTVAAQPIVLILCVHFSTWSSTPHRRNNFGELHLRKVNIVQIFTFVEIFQFESRILCCVLPFRIKEKLLEKFCEKIRVKKNFLFYFINWFGLFVVFFIEQFNRWSALWCFWLQFMQSLVVEFIPMQVLMDPSTDMVCQYNHSPSFIHRQHIMDHM